MSKEKDEQRKRSRLRRLEDLDSVVPSPREIRFFELYQEYKSQETALLKLREEEGKTTDVPDGSLRTITYRFMQRPGVIKLQQELDRQIGKVIEKKLAKYALSKERVLEELVKIAFHKQSDVQTWGPEGIEVKPSADLDEDAKAAIEEVVEYEGAGGMRRLKVKTIDKTKALELLGKHLGLFKETVDHNHKVLSVNFVIEK